LRGPPLGPARDRLAGEDRAAIAGDLFQGANDGAELSVSAVGVPLAVAGPVGEAHVHATDRIGAGADECQQESQGEPGHLRYLRTDVKELAPE
jgi:hypothetical protein